MTLAIMQPYLFPYIGYFQLMYVADRFVIYDDVNFIKKGWINRNNLLGNAQPQLFTLPLKDLSQNKAINEIEIDNLANFKDKFLKTLYQNYKKAPYFQEVVGLVALCLDNKQENIADLITHSLQQIKYYLGLNTELLRSSEACHNKHLKAQDRIIDICVQQGAHRYVNAIGGQHLYDKAAFEASGIELKFIKTRPIQYKQFTNEFVAGLSIIDILMFNSVAETKALLAAYDLV